MRPFQFYLDNNKVVKQEKNIETAASLIKSAQQRWNFFKDYKADEENAFILFESYYEVIRELFQSAMAREGYKPYSHEATIAFALDTKIIDIGDGIYLDTFRKIRHDSMYYGKKVAVDDVQRIKTFVIKIMSIIQ